MVVVSTIATTLRNKPSSSPLEISVLRRAVGPQPGDWMTCLKTSAEGRPIYFAVFFKGDDILDARQSVIIDFCEQEQYSALPMPTRPSKEEIPPKQ
jgi:hypothetical protein